MRESERECVIIKQEEREFEKGGGGREKKSPNQPFFCDEEKEIDNHATFKRLYGP